MSGLRLDDFSDRELLFAYERAAGSSGRASASEVAEELGYEDLKSPSRSVSMRFGWLHSFGVLEKDTDGLWIPTGTGEQLLGGSLRKAAQRVFDEMSEEQLYAATMALTSRLAHSNNLAASQMVTRQMRYGVAQHRREHPWRRRAR